MDDRGRLDDPGGGKKTGRNERRRKRHEAEEEREKEREERLQELAKRALEEEARVWKERRSLDRMRKEDEERQSTRSESMTREQMDLALRLSEGESEGMEWDHHGDGLYSDKEGTISKKRDISETESESETSEYEDGGSPSSHNTVLHKRKPRDDQSRSNLRYSREDTLSDVTCMNVRTSTPQESLVNTSKKAKNRMSKSLDSLRTKGKRGLFKCFSRDPSESPDSVIETNSRNVSGTGRREESRVRSELSESDGGFQPGREEKKKRKKAEKREKKAKEREAYERQLAMDRQERELKEKLDLLSKRRKEQEDEIEELERKRKRKDRSDNKSHSLERKNDKRIKGPEGRAVQNPSGTGHPTKGPSTQLETRPPLVPQPGASRGGDRGRPPVGTKSAGPKRPVAGFKGQREQAKVERAQLWEDKAKVNLICFIVRNDQRGMTQDDFNDIHSAIMDAIVDHGDSFGEEGEPESPQAAGLWERVMRVMVRKEKDVEWLGKVVAAMGPYDFLKPGQEVYTFAFIGCPMKGADKEGPEGVARLARFGKLVKLLNKFIGKRTFEPVACVGRINGLPHIKVKMGLSLKSDLIRNHGNRLDLGAGSELVSYQLPAFLANPESYPDIGHTTVRKTAHTGHVKNPNFRRGGLSQKQEAEKRRAEEEKRKEEAEAKVREKAEAEKREKEEERKKAEEEKRRRELAERRDEEQKASSQGEESEDCREREADLMKSLELEGRVGGETASEREERERAEREEADKRE